MSLGDGKVPLAQRAFVLGKVFQSIPLYFAHWEDARIDKGELDAAFAALTAKAMACEDRKDFSLLMMAFLAKLNNGHTRFRDAYVEALPPLGMALRPMEECWTVWASDIPELRVGDVVQHIEGTSIEAWYEELRPYTVGSPQSRTVQFGEKSRVFRDVLGIFLPDRYTVEYENDQGSVETLTVDRTVLQTEMPPQETEGRWLSEELAYIGIPSFLDAQFEKCALAYVKEFKRASGLIVDVRGNAGGSTPGALIQALMDRPYRWWTESSPLTVGVLAHEAQQGYGGDRFGTSHLLWRSRTREPGPEGYGGRLIILVDRETWSAAEDFVMPFKDSGRALIVGETTGGSTGQPYYHAFDNGMGFGIGMKRVYLPDGGRFEGVGLAPDVAVSLRREDLYARRDPVLDRAMERMRSC